MRQFICFKSISYKFLNRLAILLCLFCAVLPAHAQTPVIVEMNGIQNCRFLDHVEGASGYGKNIDWRGLAKHFALRHAERLNASHVVLQRFIPIGSFNGFVIGSAYQCDF